MTHLKAGGVTTAVLCGAPFGTYYTTDKGAVTCSECAALPVPVYVPCATFGCGYAAAWTVKGVDVCDFCELETAGAAGSYRGAL